MALVLASLFGQFPMTSGASASGWGNPTPIDIDGVSSAAAPDIAVDSNGNAVAVWLQGNATPLGVWANRFSRFEGWAVAEQIGEVDDFDRPHVALGSKGAAVVVWSENGTAWVNSLSPSSGWETAVSVQGSGGFVHNPQVATDGSGRALVVWDEYDGNQNSIWAGWFVLGEGWGEPMRIGEGSVEGSIPRVLAHVSQAGSAIVIWSEFASGSLSWNSFVPGIGWSSPSRFETGGCVLYPRSAMSPEGNGFVVWESGSPSTGGGCAFGGFEGFPMGAVSFTSDGQWGAPVMGPPGMTPDIAVDETGNALVVWRASRNNGGGIWTSRFAPEVDWGSSSFVGGGGEGYMFPDEIAPRIAIDRHGLAVVVWNQVIRPNSDRLEIHLMASRYVAGVGWSEASTISTAGRVGISGTALAIDPAGNAIVVWTELDRIWANRFVVDSMEAQLQNTNEALARLQDALRLANESLARLTMQVLGLFIALVASVITLTFLLIRFSRRGGSPGGHRTWRTSLFGGLSASSRSASTNGHEVQAEAPTTSPNVPALPTASGPRGSEHRPAMASMRLTAKERVLLHLARYGRFTEELEVPRDLTQEGIATAAWIDQRHFSQYIGPLERDGLVRERTAHVRNGHQRRRIYELTDAGRRVALRLIARAKSEVVQVWDGEHVWDIRLGDILEKLEGKVSVLDVARHLAEAGVVDFAALGVDQENSSKGSAESDAREGTGA